MIFYRIKQFWRALNPSISAQEKIWLKNILPSPAFDLFFQQAQSEQRHALDVAHGLRPHLLNLSPKERKILLISALLHDCGKSLQRLYLWQRVFIVISEHLPKRIYQLLFHTFTFCSMPLELSRNHAAWGADLARNQGLDEEICTLIAEHHQPKTKLGKLLQAEDNKY